MMNAVDVNEILDCLAKVGVSVWLDGGWGVDALLSRQTRPHDDLDAVIDRGCLARAQKALEMLGFCYSGEAHPGLPARCVLRDSHGRQIDFHPVVFDDSGDGWQDLGDGTQVHYPARELTGTGEILGRSVPCITPELQIQHHRSYQPTAKDCRDMRALADRFHLSLPAPFDI